MNDQIVDFKSLFSRLIVVPIYHLHIFLVLIILNLFKYSYPLDFLEIQNTIASISPDLFIKIKNICMDLYLPTIKLVSFFTVTILIFLIIDLFFSTSLISDVKNQFVKFYTETYGQLIFNYTLIITLLYNLLIQQISLKMFLGKSNIFMFIFFLMLIFEFYNTIKKVLDRKLYSLSDAKDKLDILIYHIKKKKL